MSTASLRGFLIDQRRGPIVSICLCYYMVLAVSFLPSFSIVHDLLGQFLSAHDVNGQSEDAVVGIPV